MKAVQGSPVFFQVNPGVTFLYKMAILVKRKSNAIHAKSIGSTCHTTTHILKVFFSPNNYLSMQISINPSGRYG